MVEESEDGNISDRRIESTLRVVEEIREERRKLLVHSMNRWIWCLGNWYGLLSAEF